MAVRRFPVRLRPCWPRLCRFTRARCEPSLPRRLAAGRGRCWWSVCGALTANGCVKSVRARVVSRRFVRTRPRRPACDGAIDAARRPIIVVPARTVVHPGALTELISPWRNAAVSCCSWRFPSTAGQTARIAREGADRVVHARAGPHGGASCCRSIPYPERERAERADGGAEAAATGRRVARALQLSRAGATKVLVRCAARGAARTDTAFSPRPRRGVARRGGDAFNAVGLRPRAAPTVTIRLRPPRGLVTRAGAARMPSRPPPHTNPPPNPPGVEALSCWFVDWRRSGSRRDGVFRRFVTPMHCSAATPDPGGGGWEGGGAAPP